LITKEHETSQSPLEATLKFEALAAPHFGNQTAIDALWLAVHMVMFGKRSRRPKALIDTIA
jgi:hypothetical protein